METTKHGKMEVAENIKPHSMSGQYSKDQTETETEMNLTDETGEAKRNTTQGEKETIKIRQEVR